MRRATLLFALAGCLVRNPGFDEKAAPVSTTGDTSTGADASTTAEASSGGASAASTTLLADASTTDASGSTTTGTTDVLTDGTGLVPDTDGLSGPELCGQPPKMWSFGSVHPLPAPVGHDGQDDDPWLSDDGQILFFASDRGGGFDSHRASRSGLDAPFGQVVVSDDLKINSPALDGKLALSEDRLFAVLASDRGGAGMRLFFAARPMVGAPFSDFFLLPLGLEANTALADPHLSLDGLRLYFAARAEGEPLRFALVQRASRLQPFGQVQEMLFAAIAVLPGEVVDPTLSADERVLVFGYRPPEADAHDLWFAMRNDLDESFAGPMPLPGVSDPELDELGPHLRVDGCELLFVGVAKGATQREIYAATLE